MDAARALAICSLLTAHTFTAGGGAGLYAGLDSGGTESSGLEAGDESVVRVALEVPEA